jgi:GTP-binding protein HflX
MLYREAKVEQVDYEDTIRVTAVCTPKVLGRVRDFCDPPLPVRKEPWEE